jgi:serine acetyltransferase
MRKIKAGEILAFFILISAATVLGVFTAWTLFGYLPLGDFRGIILLLSGIIFLYIYALILYRLFLYLMPFKAGPIPIGTREEFSYHVYLLFYLILFYPIMRSGFIPVPLMRPFYQALGARLGVNTYSSGIILDPPFIEIGDNTLIGQYALIVPHVIENDKLAHYPVRIGNNVTVGAHSVVLAGVTIGDGALVATGAVVKKGTRIGAGEVWGGVPAKLLSVTQSEDDALGTAAVGIE